MKISKMLLLCLDGIFSYVEVVLGMVISILVMVICLFKKKIEVKVILKENTFANQQLAKYLHGVGSYKRIRIVLYEKTIIRSRYGRYYVMMSMPTPENIITGIIGAIKTPNRFARATEIIDACALTTVPTIPPANIILYRAHVATFNTAIGSAKKAAWKIVYADLKVLLFTFQIAANADQPNSITILESGSFKIKGIGKKQKQVFSLTNGVAGGTIDLVGNVTKGRCFHVWYISYDGGKTYVIFDTTFESVIQKEGLTVGQTIYFQHQYITPRGKDNGVLETLFITVT
jgi:hypothetical protein